ncbi:amidase signature enzyme [Thelephora ganbajun]|uniref:Amidase signature enzyme n=1 Tax=Thelephora ganbajun TaxID=370292 RepID=A0ACB6ZT37_THEGA|nr:amidase signature enzyme [Thelephora ganbajun]
MSSSTHKADCLTKQEKRKAQEEALRGVLALSFASEENVLRLPLAQIVDSCTIGEISPSTVRDVFLRQALKAHAATNCIAEFLPNNSATPREKDTRPFLGVPISIKDTCNYEGTDSTLGYSCNVNKPASSHSVIAQMLLDAGATLHVKTTVPTGLLALETDSDLYGYCTNPYNPGFTSGASTGGGAALLAYGGSKIEIGTDFGGSVRMPAHFNGLYSIKASHGRFPETGMVSFCPGLQGIPLVTSPMAQNLDDLIEFCRRFVDLKPWTQCHTCVPVPWRPVEFGASANRKLRFGVVWSDGITTPTPACRRALQLVVDALKDQGHYVVDYDPPSLLHGTSLALQIAFCAGSPTLRPLRKGESINEATVKGNFLQNLPNFVRRGMAWMLRNYSSPAGRNDDWATLLEGFGMCASIDEERALFAKKDIYLAEWNKSLNENNLDFILALPFPTPAIPKNSTEKATFMSAAGCFIYNFLDYSAGCMPVTFVDKDIDSLPTDFKFSKEYDHMNDITRALHELYDADAMNGLPVGVQVIGRRLEEEKVLAGMKVIKEALFASGTVFTPKEF